MDYIFEVAYYLKGLSDKADKIRKMDMDKYKQMKDMEVLESVIDEKINQLELDSTDF